MGGNGIMKHRLLILGTLGEFEQLVQKAREKGYYTIVCDGYPDGPARKFADEAFQIPVTDTERIACLCREKEIDGIITSFSDLLLECMVKIADRAGIPCYLKPEQLPWYRDKSATRALLTELGLPTPGFRKIPIAYFKDRSKRTQLKELLEGLRYPVVSKPLDKYGSRGIYISEDLEELINGAEKTAGFSDMPEILVEFNDKFCSLAILMDTGVKSPSHWAQQVVLPQTPSPLKILASSRTPIWRSSMRTLNTAARSLTRSLKSTRPSAVK